MALNKDKSMGFSSPQSPKTIEASAGNGTGDSNNNGNGNVKLACLYCRSKKVKCTGEIGGCQRCKTKNRECIYQPKNMAPSDRILHQMDVFPPQFCRNSLPGTNPNLHFWDNTNTNIDSHNLHSNVFTVTPPESSLASFNDDMISDLNSVPHFVPHSSNSTTCSSDYTPSNTSDSLGNNIRPNDRRHHRHNHLQEQQQQQLGSPGYFFPSPDYSCQVSGKKVCSENILRCFEKVSMTPGADLSRNSASSQRIRSIAPKVLQCYDQTLETCTCRIRCYSCSFESYDAMILISIADMLLDNMLRFEDICTKIRSDTRLPSQLSSRLSVTSQSPSGHCNRGLSSPPDDWSTEIPEEENLSLDLGYGPWGIQEEDAILIIHTLFSDRKSKLKSLLLKVNSISRLNFWDTHTGKVERLLRRIEASPSRQTT